MKKYVFEIVEIRNGKTFSTSHIEEHENPFNAQERAKKILAECKHDKVDVMQINVFKCEHMISYQ